MTSQLSWNCAHARARFQHPLAFTDPNCSPESQMKDRVCLQLMELDLYSENKGTIIAGLYVELFVL